MPSSKSKRPAPERTGNEPLKTSLQGSSDDHSNRPTRDASQAVSRNPRAVREARLELLREAIFENLGAVSLFAETAKILIEVRDNAGMAHSVKMGAHHYRAAMVTAKELAALKVAP